ncbi:MAG TPA: hypothetical protein VN192_04355 [Flavobacterium sp.]|nr:hypothetical protein [Flavobacterium sp.]
MKTKTKIILATLVVVIAIVTSILYSKMTSRVPDADAPTTWMKFENTRGMRFCEVFLIGGNAITKDLRAAAYNTTGLNFNSADSLKRNSCPDELVNQLDLEAYKKEYDVLAVYLNKPRFWTFDQMDIPVGPKRNFNSMEAYFMGLGIIPKDADVTKPGWLTYRKSPVDKKTILTYRSGTTVFIMNDETGKPWVMKSYRDDYEQTFESLSTLGKRYKKLPEGWKFRVVVLDRDLVVDPKKAGVISLVFQDEFENTFDYIGDGSASFVP